MATRLLHDLPPSRPAKAIEPADLVLAFDNRERYIAQSAATKTGRRAELAPRPALSAT